MFSSEIRSFLEVEKIKQELRLDTESINQYLSLNYLINNKTFFREIKSLSPASYIILNSTNFKNEISIKKYWLLEEHFKKKTIEVIIKNIKNNKNNFNGL